MIEPIDTNLVWLEIVFLQLLSRILILGIPSPHVMTAELQTHVQTAHRNTFLLRDPWVD